MRYIIAFREDSETLWECGVFKEIDSLLSYVRMYGKQLVGVWELGKEIKLELEEKELPSGAYEIIYKLKE